MIFIALVKPKRSNEAAAAINDFERKSVMRIASTRGQGQLSHNTVCCSLCSIQCSINMLLARLGRSWAPPFSEGCKRRLPGLGLQAPALCLARVGSS